jgi:hypothetical protein
MKGREMSAQNFLQKNVVIPVPAPSRAWNYPGVSMEALVGKGRCSWKDFLCEQKEYEVALSGVERRIPP